MRLEERGGGGAWFIPFARVLSEWQRDKKNW